MNKPFLIMPPLIISLLLVMSGCSCTGPNAKNLPAVPSEGAHKESTVDDESMSDLAEATWDKVKQSVKPLTEEDIKRYIQAYNNLAEIGEELEARKEADDAILIFTSAACRELLHTAIVDAGYADFKSFLIMDMRMHYTLRGVAYARLGNLLGDTIDQDADDADLKQLWIHINKSEDLDQEKKEQAKKHVTEMDAFNKHLSKLASLLKAISSNLLQASDLKLVEKYYDEVIAALSNPALPDELEHTNGSDDWDD